MSSLGTRLPATASARRGVWRRMLIAMLATMGLIVGSVAVAPSASAAARLTVAHPRIADQHSSFDAQLISYINQARSAKGLPAVREASGLTIMSAWWSRQMNNGATGGNLKHNPNAWTQVLSYGASNRRAWGENVAKMPTGTSAKALFDAYMASPGHRANILSPKYKYVGMGTVGNFNTMEFTDNVETRTVIGATVLATR